MRSPESLCQNGLAELRNVSGDAINRNVRR